MQTIMAPMRPIPGEAKPYHFPDFDRHKLANGLTVWAAPIARARTITAILLMDAGADMEDESQGGIAALTARLLASGTLRLDADAFAEAAEQLGIQVNSEAGWDSVNVVFQSLPGNMEKCIALLAEMVRQPRFDLVEVERIKAMRQAEILLERADPARLADEIFLRHVFEPPSYPYRRWPAGTTETIAGLTPNDIRAFHARHWWPGGAHLILAGAIDPDEVAQVAERYLGDWSGRGPGRQVFEPTFAKGPRVLLADRPGSAASELRIGHLGIQRSSPKYLPALVLATLLGGASGSRLNRRLRQELGYAQRASAGFDPRRNPGPFSVTATVKPTTTVAALAEVLGQLVGLHGAAPDADELHAVLDWMVGTFPLRFESTAGVADALAQLATYDLPDEYWQTYRQKLTEVTTDDVLEAAGALIHPAHMLYLVVGDAQQVRGSLEAAGLGPVEAVGLN